MNSEKPMSEGARDFDILLWGASGFPGRLVAEYLAAKLSKENICLALGGRNREKLEGVGSSLASIEAAAANLPICLADSRDLESFDTTTTITTSGSVTLFVHALFEDGFETGDLSSWSGP